MTLVGLLGEGIAASLTPPMHRRETYHLGLDYEYRVIDTALTGQGVDDLPSILASVTTEGYDALNVTHPFKQRVIPHLTALTQDAADLGAVNLVLYTDGTATGHNTDWTGFRYALEHGLGSVAGHTVGQVGAGGAGAATAFALLHSGVGALTLVDRDVQQAQQLAERLAAVIPHAPISVAASGDLPRVLATADGVVHATPTGMLHNPGIAFDLDDLRTDAWVAEVVYLPLETELVKAARARGHRVLDGGLMAVGQAVDSIRIITGLEPDAERMRQHFLTLIGAAPTDEEAT